MKGGGAMASGGSNRVVGMAEAAEYLAVPKRTLQDNYRKWGISHIRVGKAVKFRERHLESWLDANTIDR